MAHRGGYDRNFGYDHAFQGGPRRYDRGYGPMAFTPFPSIPFGYDPMMGPMSWQMPYGAGMGPAPRGFRYDRGYRVPPRQSPAYGRGGDRAVRAWAERYGYDVEFSIPPRHRPRR